MPRFLLSLMFVLLLAPFHFGCGGGDEPLHPATDADPVEELDPASEAEAVKEARQDH
ncbi:hypothetical protein [Gimesia chilikensis]|uniref:hypothetical protein n=1 Tax=Gimesia chilikensis TaxID=2605989 RepID=UPI003A8F7ABF